MEARDYVRAIRDAGLTQAQAAARSGIRQATISKIENGTVKDVLSKNYRALQVLYFEVCKPELVTPTATAGA